MRTDALMSIRLRLSFASTALAWTVVVVAAPHAQALKFAPIQHHMHADAAIPSWRPRPLEVQPEEEFNIVVLPTSWTK